MTTPVQFVATPLSLALINQSGRSPDICGPLLRAREAIEEPGMDTMPMQFSSDCSLISAYWDPNKRIVMVYTNTDHPLVNPMEAELFDELLPGCISLSAL